jgi:hypothetical protein
MVQYRLAQQLEATASSAATVTTYHTFLFNSIIQDVLFTRVPGARLVMLGDNPCQ